MSRRNCGRISASDVGIFGGDGARTIGDAGVGVVDGARVALRLRSVNTAPPTAPTVPDAKTVRSSFTSSAPETRALRATYEFRCVIREAAIAAPKPLSIFATVMPAAQLFSIVKSGAMP